MSLEPLPQAEEREALDRAIEQIVGRRGILDQQDAAIRSCDPFRDLPPLGRMIVRPANTEELSAVLRRCHDANQPAVVHGGRTGVSGGALVDDTEIAISLERMNQIVEICPVTMTAIVEGGATIEAVQEAAAAQGLFYPIDLNSKGTATVGGTIATNAGGNRVLRWGMTRAHVLGVEAVLADGTIVDAMNRLVKNNTGYDIKQFFIGSEGTLGIVSRAVLKLVPAPESQNVAFVAVESNDQLLRLLAAARRLHTISAFEVMWPDYYDLVATSDIGRRPLETGHAAYVLIEAMGYDPEQDRTTFEAFLQKLYETDVVADAVLAQSSRQVADLWRVREGADCIVDAMSPFVSFDISVDVRRVEEFMTQAVLQLEQAYPVVATATFGHLGDNNIHIAVHVGPSTVEEERNIERIVFDVLKREHGAITAEHGIGRFKKEFLPGHKHTGEMDVMRRVRQALDPRSILNRQVLF